MATVASEKVFGRANPAGIAAQLMRPAIIAPVTVLIASTTELAIADRKYGVFTGGFGQSNAVDTTAERLLFLIAFAIAQAALALAVWSACAWASKSGRAQAALNFAFLFGGGMIAAVASRYQLHSYFSDAVDFALLKQLGGGSIRDALLFGKNEIALGLAAFTGIVIAWWIAARLLGRLVRSEQPARPLWRLTGFALFAWVVAITIIPRTSDDVARGLNRMLGWSVATDVIGIATDFDGDGYGLVGSRTDDHPFDATRHPLALDIPGNGIDEDGYGGDLVLVPVPSPRPEAAISRPGPNVVIAVMESTRGEAIGKRIGGALVAPNLTALAKSGTGISESYSHVGFTTASLKSLFTGDLLPSHGAASLFTELRKGGYEASVISGQPEDFGDISATVGMRSNAGLFIDAEALRDRRAFSFAAQGSLLVDEGVLLEEFDRHFGKADAWARPQFIYLNFQSPHFPYDHPGIPHRFARPPLPRSEILAGNRNGVERTYWNAVAHSDAALGQLIGRLKSLGVWDNTLLIVSGDHGEALFEDGFLGHGHIINRQQFATFLAINRPIPGLEGPVSISDYRGILLDLLDGQAPLPVRFKPFMHIGELDRPSGIGMAGTPFGIVSLRLDRGDACFERPAGCQPYGRLQGERKRVIDALVARWGSERWARHHE